MKVTLLSILTKRRKACPYLVRQEHRCDSIARLASESLLIFASFFVGILNSTKTTLGRSLMRTWLLRPSLSIPVIEARLDAVACFMSQDNQGPINAMHGHLKGISNVPRILGIMKSGRARVSEWQGLVKVLRISIRAYRLIFNCC